MRGATLAFLLALMTLAGCVGDDAANGGTSMSDGAPPLVDALAAYQAGEPSANINRLSQWGGGAQEADAWGDYLFVDRGANVTILDVSLPGDFEEVSTIEGLVDIQDVKVSDDGNWLFIGNDEELSNEPLGGTVRAGGFYVFDISDKKNPRQTDYLGVGPRRGPHMVTYHKQADGTELVFGANADVSINRFDPASGTLTELSRYQAGILTAFNRDPEVFDVLYQGWAHDMFVMEDAVAHKTLMYVANWDAGLRIVDITDPSNPIEVGGWNDFPEGHEGNLHTVSTEWIGDRRITVGSVEVGFAVVGGYHYFTHTDRSIVYVWDTTNPLDIKLLGMWENPDHLPADRDQPPPVGEGTESSTHNFQLEDGRIYLAHYNLGVWVLDISTPALQAAPALLGYHFEPDDNVWDIVLNNGVLYSSGAAGVVALHYAPDAIGPDGIDSRA